MLGKLQHFFIGNSLAVTDDVFERARIIMFYRFGMSFVVLFLLPLFADYHLNMHKALVKHGLDYLFIVGQMLFLRRSVNMDKYINFFFCYICVTSMIAAMMLNPMDLDAVAVLWTIFFLALSAILQKGWWRIVYCFVLGWLPTFYVILNIEFKGALTSTLLAERPLEGEPPMFLLFLPMVLLIMALWSHANTIQKARETITSQKKLIEERNTEILDSIHYARRIQNAFLPSEKLVNKRMEDTRKKG